MGLRDRCTRRTVVPVAPLPFVGPRLSTATIGALPRGAVARTEFGSPPTWCDSIVAAILLINRFVTGKLHSPHGEEARARRAPSTLLHFRKGTFLDPNPERWNPNRSGARHRIADHMATTDSEPRSFQAVSPLRLLTPLLLRRWRVILFGLYGAAVGVAVAFALPKRYTATIRFVAQGPSGPTGGTGVAKLAQQFGFALDIGSTGVTTPLFYTDLVYTRAILEPVVTQRYALSTTGRDTVDLIGFLEVQGASERDRVERAMRKLRRTVTVDLTKSGLTTVQVALADPHIAAAVANALLARLNTFTVEQLQSQSRQQRQFAEHRLEAAQEELRKAEEEEVVFLQRNQIFERSPVLRARYARLQRAIQIKQEIVLTLARSYEEARLEETRDVPTLTVLEAAVPPVRRSWPPRGLIAVGGLLLGMTAGIVSVWLAHWLQEATQERRPEVLEFVEAWQAAIRRRRR